jgi:hypothetical protein
MDIIKFPKYKRKGEKDSYHIHWDEIKDEIGRMSLAQLPEEISSEDYTLQGFIHLPFSASLSGDDAVEEDACYIPCICFMSENGLVKLVALKTLMPHLECFK